MWFVSYIRGLYSKNTAVEYRVAAYTYSGWTPYHRLASAMEQAPAVVALPGDDEVPIVLELETLVETPNTANEEVSDLVLFLYYIYILCYS